MSDSKTQLQIGVEALQLKYDTLKTEVNRLEKLSDQIKPIVEENEAITKWISTVKPYFWGLIQKENAIDRHKYAETLLTIMNHDFPVALDEIKL